MRLASSSDELEADGRPRVTVVIPTYNYAPLLAEAIESALRQGSVGPEVIVVDDGSTDEPDRVVSRYPSVRLIKQKNKGLSEARNVGWRAARGDHVVFLDADDRLLDGALATTLALYDEHPEAGFVHASYRSVDPEWRPIWQPDPIRLDPDPYGILLSQGNRIGMAATVLFRRSHLQAVGGFDADLQANEDFDLYLRLARHLPVASSPTVVAEYRYHHVNMSRDAVLMLTTSVDVLERQRPFCCLQPERLDALSRGQARMRRFWVRTHYKTLRGALRTGRGLRAAFVATFRLLAVAPLTTITEPFRSRRHSLAPGLDLGGTGRT